MKPEAFKVACSNCNLRELCMPVGMDRDEMIKLDTLVAGRRRLAKGDVLFGLSLIHI